MTFKIKKSDIGPDFAVAVAAHAKELRDWKDQMKIVEIHRGNDKIPPMERYVERKRPESNSLIESAINENGEPDFEIIDDGPSPEQILSSKKMLLIQKALIIENQIKLSIVPAGKHRLWNLQFKKIADSDSIRMQELVAKVNSYGLLERFSKERAEVLKKLNDPDLHSKSRDPDDQKFVLEHEERHRRLQAVELWAAQVQSDIEDLTIDNVDAWKMPDFPK